MTTTRRDFLAGTAAIAAGTALPGAAGAAIPGLPDTLVWSTYDVGSTGYVEASAIADAIGKAHGTRVRLQNSGTSIGRVLPVVQKRANYGWLANELFFAVEGIYEYAVPDWGPQDLRVLMGRASSFSIAATKVSGITKPEDLKGKRIAVARANSSVMIKTEPILAFAGLTWNDVEVVEFPSYGATLAALVTGKADAAGAAPQAAKLRELEASPNGISWVQLSPENKAGWARAQKAVPFVSPFQETVGAGLSADKPAWVMGYRYPMITTLGSTDANEVYAVTKAIAETFDSYKDVSPIMQRWNPKDAGTGPMDAPFHDGAIRYLKEAGFWTADTQAWQTGAVARQAALRKAWAAFKGGQVPSDAAAFTEAWMARRAETLKTL
jgi:TRAP transporter TAXI family solute receptor